MKNIFLLYIPPGNHEAVVHYEDTIRRKVAQDRVIPYIDSNLRSVIERIFGGRDVAIWGSRDSSANRSKFEKMALGDEILIIEGATIKLLGKIAAKTINPDLSRELWRNLQGDAVEGWDLIYFIANPVEIDLPFVEFCRLLGYEESYQLRGFSSVSKQRLEEFYAQYDDLYSILMQIREGHQVCQLPQTDLFGEETLVIDEVRSPDEMQEEEAAPNNGVASDHVKMQCKLAGLGIKSGSKVWVPTGDQRKVQDQCGFDDFETDFAAGLDTQTRYVENIDVVWKEEFRIDAAFEIENSTAIYSGLLRFADLTLVAPNTIYPLFIVAPREKRNRLVEQLKRPAFRQFNLENRVRYLSYESVDEITQFFEQSMQGLNVEVIKAKSENFDL